MENNASAHWSGSGKSLNAGSTVCIIESVCYNVQNEKKVYNACLDVDLYVEAKFGERTTLMCTDEEKPDDQK